MCRSMWGCREFLSTPSARRATWRLLWHNLSMTISIHALREEGDQVKPIFVVADLISIHALREEGDPTCSQMARRNVLFLSTPSARRATDTARRLKLDDIISIHALREEGDSSWTSCCCR